MGKIINYLINGAILINYVWKKIKGGAYFISNKINFRYIIDLKY